MPEGHHRQATLHDVARVAGVSHQTVSRVINNSPNVSIDTRSRVNQAIEALNYRPNRAARSLITGRSQTIQVIDFSATYITPIPVIVRQSNELGYRVGVSILREGHTREDLRLLMDDLTSRLVDGFLLFDPQERIEREELDRLSRGVPYVQLGGNPMPEVPSVLVDHAAGITQVMNHLMGLGHKRIAEISGPLTSYDALIRHQTYLQNMEQAGFATGPCLEGNFETTEAYRLTSELLRESPSFSAIVCGNDDTALGALRALHERRIRVPEDISVTGFDDHLQVKYYEPPLTTVCQDYAAMSLLGLQYLLSFIEKPQTEHRQIVVCPDLVIRQSTGKARSVCV